MDLLQPVNQLTKVLIRGDEDRVTPIGCLQNFVVVDARRKLNDGNDIMAGLPQNQHNLPVDTFIDDQIHALCFATG